MKTVATFDIKFIQFIDEEGTPLIDLPEIFEDKTLLLELYKTMSLIRAFDKRAISLQRTGKMGTYASVLGQEAISTAIGITMSKNDIFVPYYREYAAQYLRRVKLSELFLYWGGDERGSNYINNKYDLPISVPIGSQYLHASGLAYAIKYKKLNQAVVAVCGDGATSQGDFYEALNVAGVWQLPVVFVINNNQWAISVPLTKQTGTITLAQKAIAGGFEGLQVDGNDIFALIATMQDALKKAKAGKGPTLIEAITYRLCDHTTADDATRYRDPAEVEFAWKKEPIRRLRKFLINEKILDESIEKKILEEIKSEIEQAVSEYLNIGLQSIESIFDFMFETIPHSLQEQKDEALRDLNRA